MSESMRKCSLLTMGAGNVKVLRKTFESFSLICDEIIYGDLLLFDEDREVVNGYKKDFNIKIIPIPFDYIFARGFSDLLNLLSMFSKNALVIYANTGEVIEQDFGTIDVIENNPQCNCFYFTHKTDPHRWFRLYDWHELRWSGLIHEQLKPFKSDFRPYHKSVFQMADLPKDNENLKKAKILDTLKELVYFQQYIEIVDKPDKLGETDPGWVQFAKNDYESFKDRLQKRGRLYEALRYGNYAHFMKILDEDKDWETGEYKSSLAVEFQIDKRYLL
jgi:deoxyadenosine/deoxycytidine kinase